MKSVPEISYSLVPLGETLQNRFITPIMGGHICNYTEQKFLPYLLALVDFRSLLLTASGNGMK